MSTELIITLVIFVLTMAGFACNKFSFGTVAIFTAVALQATGVLTGEETWAGLSNSTVIMMAGMFIVGAGLAKTSLLSKISRSMIKPDSSDRKIIIGLGIMTFIFGLFVNATATATFMMPIVYQVCKDCRKEPVRLVQPVAALAMIWAGVIPLGGNAGGYIGFNTMIENMGGTGDLHYFSTMLSRLLPSIAASLVIVFFYDRYTAKKQINPVEMDVENIAAKKTSSLTPEKEKFVFIVFTLVVIGTVVGALSGLYEIYIPSLIGALLMSATKVLTPREIHTNCGLTTIFLFAGMLPLSTALGKTGGTEILGNAITTILGGNTNVFFVCGVYFILTAILTQFMSNSAVGNIFKPLAIASGITIGINPGMLMLAVQAGSSLALLTPMSSASQAIGFEKGGYTMKQYFLGGILPWITYTIVFCATTPLIIG